MARGTLGVEPIVAAAFAVLERGGLAGVTARAVAAELGVQAGAIYYHLPDMAALYDEMATELQRRMQRDTPVPTEWAALIRAFGQRCRAVLLDVRDGGRLFAGRRLRDPGLLTAMERPLEVLTAAGLEVGEAALCLQAVRDLVAGFVIEEQHRSSQESGRYDAAGRAALVDRRTAPLSRAASGPLLDDPDARFAFALDLLVDGIRARLPR